MHYSHKYTSNIISHQITNTSSQIDEFDTVNYLRNIMTKIFQKV